MNVLEVIYHLRFNRWQCAVFWRCTVDDLYQLDDRLFSAGHRLSSHRHYDAGSAGLLHVGGVPQWQSIKSTSVVTLAESVTRRR